MRPRTRPAPSQMARSGPRTRISWLSAKGHEQKFLVRRGNTQPPLHKVRNSRSYAGPPAQRRPFERTTDMNRPRAVAKGNMASNLLTRFDVPVRRHHSLGAVIQSKTEPVPAPGPRRRILTLEPRPSTPLVVEPAFA